MANAPMTQNTRIGGNTYARGVNINSEILPTELVIIANIKMLASRHAEIIA